MASSHVGAIGEFPCRSDSFAKEGTRDYKIIEKNGEIFIKANTDA